jgi:glutaredoxin
MSIRQNLKVVTLTCTFLVMGSASAQYKWIDTDGNIGYGDHVPPTAAKVLKGPRGFKSQKDHSGTAQADTKTAPKQDLPPKLARVVESFPVTLYTTTACAPCDMARQHLKRRGVPYVEKTVSTSRDLQAFSALGFDPDTGIPVLSVGEDKRTGYHAAQWNQLLGSSGYPKKSALPAGYEFAEAEALSVASQTANNSEGFGSNNSVASNSRRNPAQKEASLEDKPGFRF